MVRGSAARPDILIVEANVSPVCIETEVLPAVTVEVERGDRLEPGPLREQHCRLECVKARVHPQPGMMMALQSAVITDGPHAIVEAISPGLGPGRPGKPTICRT